MSDGTDVDTLRLKIETDSNEITPSVLKEHDQAKILTGRNLETLLKDSGRSFNELFGYNRVTKAILALLHESKIVKNPREIDVLCISITELRKEIRESNKSLNRDELDMELFRQAVSKYLSQIAFVDAQLLLNYSDDSFMNIGDPYQVTARKVDEQRTTVVDYEYAQDVVNLTRTVDQVQKKIRDARDGKGTAGWYQNAHDMNSWIKQISTKLNPLDAIWFSGFYDSVTGEKKLQGFEEVVENALKLAENLSEGSAVEALDEARVAWRKVRDYLDIRKKYFFERGKDVTKPDYDTDFGLSPLDGLCKEAFYMSTNATEALDVLAYYREVVYPDIVYEYLEDLADAHLIFISSGEDHRWDSDEAHYKSAWFSSLNRKGFDPLKYEPFDEDSKFVDILIEFFLHNGTDIIKGINRELFERIRSKETDLLSEEYPVKKTSKESTVVRGMFPYTQEFEPNKFDRILASWSFSAHMIPNLTERDLTDLFWPELDRLLAPGGISVIFPVGHYGETIEDVIATIYKYNEKYGAHLIPSHSQSGDERFPNDSVLVIQKGS